MEALGGSRKFDVWRKPFTPLEEGHAAAGIRWN
jgi:hypothetical protein